jgi:phosphatidylglycerophosphatase C
MTSAKELHLFDFDGTITWKDSLKDFIQYALGKNTYYMGLIRLSPILIAYKLGWIRNDLAKAKLITYFFKGWNATRFQKLADGYALERIDKITRPRAMRKIKELLKMEHQVVIVTASMENWLEQWCKINHIDLIGTRLEVQNGKLTGRFSSRNCYGMEKVNRINERLKIKDFNVIHAYGDSKGDREMLNIADHSYYKYF